MRTNKFVILSLILSFMVSGLYAEKLSGVVNDDRNQSIANAEVFAYGYASGTPDSMFYSATSNENGLFSFDHLVNGTYYIQAHSFGDLYSETAGPYEITENSDILGVELIIQFGSVEFGTVSGLVKMDDETPVAWASLELFTNASDSSRYPYFSYSDENGHFIFQDVEPGEYDLISYHPLGFRKDYPDKITVVANQETKDITIVFSQDDLAFGSLSGFVKTDTGLPLEGVEIEVYSEGFNNRIADSSIFIPKITTTDAEGKYAFNELAPGEYLVSSVHPVGGYKQLDAPVEVIANQAVTAADIIYTTDEIATGYVTGSVMIGSGSTPAVGAFIEFISINSDSLTFYRIAPVLTDEAGHYKATLSPGKYIVMCQYSDSQILYFVQYYDDAQDMDSATKIEVNAEQTVQNIDFTIPEPLVLPNVSVSGVVSDEQGNALAGATVELIIQLAGYGWYCDSLNMNDLITQTDSDGKYSFLLNDVNSPATQIIVAASAEGYLREFYDNQKEFYLADVLVPGEQTVFDNIDFALATEPAALPYTFSGIVLSDEGVAIVGAEVTAYHTDDFSITSTRTDAEGKYELGNLFEGNYVIQFYAPGFIPEFFDNKENWELADLLTPDQSLSNINASLTPFSPDSSSGKIMGTVSAVDGAELGGVLVSIKNSTGNTVGFDFTDSYGQYRIDGLKNGNLTVAANRVQYEYKRDELNLPDATSPTRIHNISLQKTDAATSISTNLTGKNLPSGIELNGNYPNPFNPVTNIRFTLNQAARVTVTIYNIMGQEIIQLKNSSNAAGTQSLQWNALNKNGVRVQSGVYLYRVNATFENGKKATQTGRMLLVK